MRPRFSTRSSAVLVTALSWWLLALLQSAKWITLLDMQVTPALLLGALMYPAMAAVIAFGAWLYERDATG